MQHFLSVQLRVIVLADDDVTQLRKLLYSFLPGVEQKQVPIQEDVFVNSADEKQYVFTLQFTKRRFIRIFEEAFLQKIQPVITTLQSDIEKRLDEHLSWYVRLHLDTLLMDKVMLTKGGRCLHCKMTVAAYPSRREVAIAVLEKYLKKSS